MERTICIDGQLLPASQAKVSVLLYGDGIFEGIRFYNGRVYRLEQHIRRLYDCARSTLRKLPLTPGKRRGQGPANQSRSCTWGVANGGWPKARKQASQGHALGSGSG